MATSHQPDHADSAPLCAFSLRASLAKELRAMTTYLPVHSTSPSLSSLPAAFQTGKTRRLLHDKTLTSRTGHLTLQPQCSLVPFAHDTTSLIDDGSRLR